MGQYFSYFTEANIEFNKYGWRPDSPNFHDEYIKFEQLLDVVGVDLRKKMPGVYNQLNIGSSVANAVASAYEFHQIKLDENHIFIPSRLFIYYNTRLIENSTEYDAGVQIRNTIKSLNIYGLCSETKWCYDSRLLAVRPDDRCYEQISEGSVKYNRLYQTVDSLKACLSNGLPFIFGFSVYDNFELLGPTNTILNRPNEGNSYVGGHCCLCVGFDDEKKTFIIRNSFGIKWGDKGHFHMSYDYVADSNLCRDFWVITI